MAEAKVLSALIEDIYDAALEPARWPSALRHAASFVGASAASLYAKETATRGVDIYHDDGQMDGHWVQSYAQTYTRVDPSTTRHFFTEVGQAVSTTDVMAYREFARTRFFEEWAGPQGLVDGLSAVLEKSGTRLTMFTAFRTRADGMIDAGTRRRMGLIVPHVRRAALVAGAVAGASTRTAALADTLDAIESGVFVLDRSGRVLHANAPGRAMLAANLVLGSSSGRLVVTDAVADRALAAALAAGGAGDMALAAQVVAIPVKARDGELYVAHLLPLGIGARELRQLPAAVAALFVHKAALGRISAPEAIAKAYRLTPTELRVLLAVVEIGGAPEVADALGVGQTTVKFHLRRLFEKTGVRRQADLVKLVAGFTRP